MAETNSAANDVVVAEKFKFRDMLHKEDWLSIWGAFILIAIAAVGVVTGAYDFSGAKFGTWGLASEVAAHPGKVKAFCDIFTGALGAKLALTFAAFAAIFTVGNALEGKKPAKFLVAFTGLFVLVSVVRLLSAEFTFNRYLEYAFWALLLGLLISNTVRTPAWLKPALRTEFYIKTGLVILGAQVLFSNIQKFGLYGLGIAWGVTPVVIIFMWWLGAKVLKIQNKPLVITIAAATSVCGTSAAIAAAAAARAKKTDLAFAVGTSLIFTVLMMVGMPFFITAIHIDPMIGGAWIGGTVDSTGAVVLAGQALGDIGGQVAALVKMIQNILIGFVALGIAIFFTTSVDRAASGGQKVGAGEIWQRFPKFILGFIAASMIFSFVVQPVYGAETTTSVIKHLKEFQNWAFALAFTSIGLETNFKDLCGQVRGGKPFHLYIIGQLFNLVLTFVIAWALLCGRFFPVPTLNA
ncbi:MAG: YeiH family protein [Kiritimatiellia bacterium]